MRRHESHKDESDAEFDRFLEVALSEYDAKQGRFQRELSGFTRWEIDEASLTISFYSDDGRSLQAAFVPLATYLPKSESWAWAWANESWSTAARAASAHLKELAGVTGYKIFSVAHFNASPDEVDELCAASLKHLGAWAVFKVKDQEPWALLAVDEVQQHAAPDPHASAASPLRRVGG